MNENLYNYVLQHADNCLILGQRLSEWCGYGPALEQDIAMTNISLDLIGQARMWYQYATKIQGEGKTEDDLAYLRDAWEYRNVLLTELPNGDFAQTIFRQFLYDTYSVNLYEALMKSKDEKIASIAAKSHKEALYHVTWSGTWVVRLGNGTEESHHRIKASIEELWTYSDELTKPNEVEIKANNEGYGIDMVILKEKRDTRIHEVLTESSLQIPTTNYAHTGGKDGQHTEHLGYILSDLQFLQRAYPGQKW